MKLNNLKNSLLIIILVLMSGSSLAQQNENITFSEERKDSSDYRYRRLYQYLDINMKDEKWMFKVSPDFSLSKYNKQFGLQLSYEHKIHRQFSFLLINRNSYNVQREYSYSYFNGSNIYGPNSYFHTNISAGLRWYYNLNVRVKNGTSGDNLSGLYAEAGIDNIAYYSHGNLFRKSNASLWTDNGFHVLQSFDPRVAVGFQRRFNNWSYFDIFITANHTYGALYCDLGFRLGFAWGKLKNCL